MPRHLSTCPVCGELKTIFDHTECSEILKKERPYNKTRRPRKRLTDENIEFLIKAIHDEENNGDWDQT